MVFEKIIQGVASTADVDPHTCTCARCKCRTAQRIVADDSRHRATRGLIHFEDFTCIESLAAIGFDLLYQVAIPIVDELGGLPANRHRRQAVFDVIGLGVGLSILHAGNHTCTCARCKCIPIGVIGIGLAGTERGHGVLWFVSP
jgi:hypothetical protein